METTKRIFEFYSRLCPRATIEIHVASRSYMHEGNTIREGEYTARVVVVDPKDDRKVVCTLAAADGRSPEGALSCLLTGYKAPVTEALKGLGPVVGEYRDTVVVQLPKEGTREHRDAADAVAGLRQAILKHQEMMDGYEKR